MADDLRTKAQAVLATYNPRIQQQHRDAWARIENDLRALAGSKAKVYEVHHLIETGRNLYFAQLVGGQAADHCERCVKVSMGL